MAHLFICTGEVSGDLQGSALIKALREADPSLRISAVGGQRMAAAGATLLHDTTGISSMGLIEALPFILPTLWMEQKIRRFLDRDRPDLAILIDYIGVNNRMGLRLHKLGIPVIFYIAPQEWVWSYTPQLSSDITTYSRLILAIFRAEADHYQQHGGSVTWVGHPMVDILAGVCDRETARQHLCQSLGWPDPGRIITLVPASRPQELRLVAPQIIAAALQIQAQVGACRFVLPLARPQFRKPLAKLIRRSGLSIQLWDGDTRLALRAADLVIAKSGTVNLETAILGVPQVVVYRLHPITYWIGKQLLNIKIPFASPTNLVLMREIVPELLQEAATPERITAAALPLLTDTARQQQLQADYAEMRSQLGQPGVLKRAVSEIQRLLAGLSQS